MPLMDFKFSVLNIKNKRVIVKVRVYSGEVKAEKEYDLTSRSYKKVTRYRRSRLIQQYDVEMPFETTKEDIVTYIKNRMKAMKGLSLIPEQDA